ncbi:hypothetical protein ACOMHN_032248 [Nucella lapillus]
MSNRALRKLQQAADVSAGPGTVGEENGEEEEKEEEESPPHPARRNKVKKRHVNPFELLADGAEKEEEEDENEEEETAGAAALVSKSSSSSGKKKKQKKKKKKKADDTASSSQAVENQDGVEDEIDASIQEVNRILGDAGLTRADSEADHSEPFTANMKALLNIEYKNLNPGNELRRRFGSRVVQAEEQGRARRRNQPLRRQNRLAQPKDNWPHFARTGLSMSILTEGGTGEWGGDQCFTFEHSPQYRNVQFSFLDAVRSMNPQNIADLIRDHPYHIDSLITLSEVFHFNEDHETAVDLIERALHVFELALHPRFNMAAGNCRLDFRRQENRAMFLVLFKHMLAVSQRGCNRTALELCKLLLSLDPDGDPMCALLVIDYFALRSQEYSFLVRLFEEWESFRNLSQLPNFAFSVPLALFRMAKKDPALAERADAMLAESLLMFPGLLMTLLDKCGVSVTSDKEVSSHPFFGPAAQASQSPAQQQLIGLCVCRVHLLWKDKEPVSSSTAAGGTACVVFTCCGNTESQSPALQQLVGLYVCRTHLLWKDKEVMEWLETVVRSTLRLVDAKDPRINDFTQKRNVRYQGTPRNIYRHIIVSDIKDVRATLPPDIAESDSQLASYDPLPPLDAIVSYRRFETPRNQEESSNMLSLFLRSMMPNYGQGGAGPQGAEGPALREAGGEEEEEEGAAGGANAALRRPMEVLMDAMRDLLQNIRMAQPPVENNAPGEDGEERPAEEWDDHLEEWD